MDWRGGRWSWSPILQQHSQQDAPSRGISWCSIESQTPRSWRSPGKFGVLFLGQRWPHLHLSSSVLFLADTSLSFGHDPSQAFFHQYHKEHGREGFGLTSQCADQVPQNPSAISETWIKVTWVWAPIPPCCGFNRGWQDPRLLKGPWYVGFLKRVDPSS